MFGPRRGGKPALFHGCLEFKCDGHNVTFEMFHGRKLSTVGKRSTVGYFLTNAGE